MGYRPNDLDQRSCRTLARLTSRSSSQISDFLLRSICRSPFLIQDLLVESTVQLIIGPPKTFKTFADTEMHLQLRPEHRPSGVF